MKVCAVICVFAVVCCVRESDSFKILNKLKNIIHPTESTTTILPSLPEYEKQSQFHQEDSKSWEHESSTSKTTRKHSEKDDSTSQSSEENEDSFTNSNKPNKVKLGKTDSQAGDSFKPDLLTTTTSNYDSGYSSNNQLSSSGHFNNQESQTTNRYDQIDNNEKYPDQSSIPDNVNNQYAKSTTPTTHVFTNQNQYEQSFEGLDNQRTQTTTSRSYDGSYDKNELKKNSNVPQNQNHDDGLPFSSNFDSEKLRSTTPRNNDGSYGIDNPNQSSSFDGQKSETTSTKHETQNGPEQSFSFDHFNNDVRSTTLTYENTNYNEIQTGESSGNKYDDESFVPKSTTSRNPEYNSESSFQGGNQHNQTPESLPSYSTAGSNQTKHNDNNDGAIIFPDDPSLNPTPESLRIFEKGFHKVKGQKGSHSVAPIPVNEEEGRRIIDGPLKECGPGKILDKQKGVCKGLARK